MSECYKAPTTQENLKRVVAVGGLTVDLTHTFVTDTPKHDGKTKSDSHRVDIGGGATNFTITTRILSRLFKKQTHVTLVTKVGDPIPKDLTSETAHFICKTALSRYKINVVDCIENTPFRIPFNAIEEHMEGRQISIATEKRAETLAEGFEGTIRAIIGAADYVFIDPNKRTISRMGLKAAKDTGVPAIIDYGNRIWPEDPMLAEIYTEMLTGADILIVPADAIVEGMNTENGSDLFERLKTQYGAKTILMSDGAKPVRVFHDNQEHSIDITPHEGPLFALGVGDTRDAALLRFILDGYPMVQAMTMATRVASVKVRYPGREWETHLLDAIADDPLFADYTKVTALRA